MKVLPGTRQPLDFVNMHCPASAVIYSLPSLPAVAVHNGVCSSWNIDLIGGDPSESPLDQCSIMYRGDPCRPGGSLEVGLEAALLPAIGEVMDGAAEDHQPEGGPADAALGVVQGENIAVENLADSKAAFSRTAVSRSSMAMRIWEDMAGR